MVFSVAQSSCTYYLLREILHVCASFRVTPEAGTLGPKQPVVDTFQTLSGGHGDI